MLFNTKLIVSLLAAVPSAFAAVNGSCSYGKKGICITTSTCTSFGGSYTNGNCPNDASNIKCCDNISCKNGTGKCMFTSECKDGTIFAGYCPGNSNFRCCVPKKEIGEGDSCTAYNKPGTCINTNKQNCSTTLVTGKCKGPSNVRCCLKEKITGLLAKAQAAADYARANAGMESQKRCAKYVANALQYGGGFSFTRQEAACQYYTNGILTGIGFTEIARPSSFNKGDIIVHECNAYHEYGHIQIYNDGAWYSDFKHGEYVYSSHPSKLHYYRILE